MRETLLFKFILSPRGNFDVLVQTNDYVTNVLSDNRRAIAAELRILASRCERQEWPFPERDPDEPDDERIREGGQFGMGA